MTIEDKVSRCYQLIAVYYRMLLDGYSVSEDEVKQRVYEIMEGGRTPARADAPAGVPTNADCKTS